MSSSNPVPLQISGYYIFPLSLPPLSSFPTTATHYLYLANHKPKIPSPTSPRSLFLINVPFDATDTLIKHLLSTQLGLPNGRIENVQFEGQTSGVQDHTKATVTRTNISTSRKKRKRSVGEGEVENMEGANLPSTWDRELHGIGHTAIVMFVDRPSMEAVIKAVKKARKDGIQPVWGEGLEGTLPALGFARYLNHHNLQYPDKKQLLESVNNYMTAFGAQEAQQARLRARQRQEADEDGFVMVTRGGRNGPAKSEVAQEQAEKQKKKRKGLEDFYRFQTREKRKAKAGELVKKFAEDKEKVRRMKETKRRFKVNPHKPPNV
ncbi:Ribosomal RNA-processing protein 7 [Lobaria immixta]|nr:Ribosomal RNA-processing protein 7 [Lobaria immixta]